MQAKPAQTQPQKTLSSQANRPAQPQPSTRRNLLKWLSFGGAGVAIAAFTNELFKAQFPSSSSIPSISSTAQSGSSPSNLKRFSFDAITVNDKGEETKKQTKEAQFFSKALWNDVSLEMVLIPAGTFQMGSTAGEDNGGTGISPQHPVTAPGLFVGRESPKHTVTVPTFFMGRYEVTQAQYEAIMGNKPSEFEGKARPVEQVSWNDAREFCHRLSQKAGRGYRLPSEAEWEYACRAGTTTPFHFGETITSRLANCNGREVYRSEARGEYRGQTTNVGGFPPNAFGLYDMHGNVSEWCEDVYHDDYQGAPRDGSDWTTVTEDAHRLVRGGSWFSFPRNCRSTIRAGVPPTYSDNSLGFRVACSA